MALNPNRSALGRNGLDAYKRPTPFQAEADVVLSGFRALRSELERKVRRGDLTVKAAREQATAAASAMKSQLHRQSEGYSPVPRAFLDRLVEAAQKRARSRETMSIEGLQRETNRLLRQSLVEQQLQTRAGEFEGRTFARPLHGGPASPTLDGLLAFHESSTQAGDEAAREWARRQLEAMRPRVPDPDDRRRIDQATDRPDRVNPRTVARYAEAMAGKDIDEMEAFVVEAIGERDASACVAAFAMAREAPEGASLRWVRTVLNGVGSFPDAALEALRSQEAEARRADAEAARAHAEHAAAVAESEARLDGLEAPTAAEIDRQLRLEAPPVAEIDRPIGLALGRRGLSPEEFEALAEAPAAE